MIDQLRFSLFRYHHHCHCRSHHYHCLIQHRWEIKLRVCEKWIFVRRAPYFLLVFVKPFDWWASKAIGDWKGPDVGYLSAWAYFWAKADKLTWQNIPSKPRPVTLDRSLFISNLPTHLDLSCLKDVAGNSTHSYLPNWVLPYQTHLIGSSHVELLWSRCGSVCDWKEWCQHVSCSYSQHLACTWVKAEAGQIW